jgi:methionyl-tRNA formyltransferase
MNPWPGSHTRSPAGTIKVHRSEPGPADPGGAAPGTVIRASGGVIEVACASGTVRLTVLQAEGRRSLAAEEFLRGTDLPAGTVLSGERDD